MHICAWQFSSMLIRGHLRPEQQEDQRIVVLMLKKCQPFATTMMCPWKILLVHESDVKALGCEGPLILATRLHWLDTIRVTLFFVFAYIVGLMDGWCSIGLSMEIPRNGSAVVKSSTPKTPLKSSIQIACKVCHPVTRSTK